MKIGIIPDTLDIIGTSVAVQGTAACLQEFGQDITYIMVDGLEGETCDEKNRKLLHTHSYKLKDLARIMDGFDVVLISNGVFMPFGLEASRFTRKALVCEILHFHSISGITPSIDVTIAVSEYIYREMQPRENDILIPNGIDLAAFQPAPRRTGERVRIIQVAAAAKTMNPDLADIAGELLKEGLPIEAHLVGRDEPSEEHIVYHGMTEHHRIPVLLSESDILVHMSESDTFGLAPVEAMSMGTIPVVSNVGGLPYSVEDGVSGFTLPPGDREAVKRLIRTLVARMADSPDDIERLRKNAILRVASHFDIRKNTRALLAHLRDKQPVLPRRNRSSGYPFSLIAPTAFFLQFQSDAFLEAFEEVFHADHLAEAFGNWRQFLAFAYKRYHSYRYLLLFLDRVYDRMLADAEVCGANARSAFHYWLAALAVVLDRPARAADHLLSGAKQDLSRDRTARERFIDEGLSALKRDLVVAFGNRIEAPAARQCDAFKRTYYAGGAGNSPAPQGPADGLS